MIRLFNVYYPVRTLVLMITEAVLVCSSFIVAVIVEFGHDSDLVLNYEHGVYKILVVAAVAMLCFYFFDLYAPYSASGATELYVRLLIVLGALSIILAALGVMFSNLMIGNHVFLLALTILTLTLSGWRWAYAKVTGMPAFQEKVYVLGSGKRAENLVKILRKRPDLGMEVVGWAADVGAGSASRDAFAESLQHLSGRTQVHRIIVATTDRRGTLPISELLSARLGDVRIEEASSLLEKISGQLEINDLQSSSLVFSTDLQTGHSLRRDLLSLALSVTGILVCLPLVPLIALAIRLSSPGPILFSQKRVGRGGKEFLLYKFRSMDLNAEAGGPTWAEENDPRVKLVGRFLRTVHLDEIPQLWNVLKGDMAFVGPRPERPEFVQWLTASIPYYQLRHSIRPGLTGWAQVNYPYSASVAETEQKLAYDLYYIKHLSVSLDLLIVFRTMKIVLWGWGAR